MVPVEPFAKRVFIPIFILIGEIKVVIKIYGPKAFLCAYFIVSDFIAPL